MDAARETANVQATLWNGTSGHAWVVMQESIDHVLKPLEDLLVGAVSAGTGGRILDVGCGTGGTTVGIARVLGAKGRCVGIDISDPMIAGARSRAEREGVPASFICGDAQTHAFEPGSFDWIISRFGVMFFEDPVQAFANLRLAAAENAGMRVLVWRSVLENPFMTTAERAAAPVLPDLPARQPDAPGQFAFADRDRVHDILEKGGWSGIDIRPLDVTCTMPEDALVPYFTHLGPVGRVFQEADDRTRAQIIEVVRPAFDSYVHGAEVRFTAACWMVSAQADSSTSA